MTTEPTLPPDGINLYGYLTSNVGLGVSARNTLRALTAGGVPTRAVDWGPISRMPRADDSVAAQVAVLSDAGPFGVNLFHVNPDRLRLMINPWATSLDLSHRVNAAVPFWEAPHLPRAWVETLRAMDVILAPSRFILDALQSDLPEVRAVHYPQTVYLPDGVAPDRARFGIGTDVVAFVTSFAIASDIERKNPWATIDAFGRAFGDDPARLLIIKVNVPQGAASAQLKRLSDACSRHANIRLLTEPLTYPEVLSLYASCDALVSLHRAEGLGLSMLEAMSLGVPAIATGWSGNMDFMTPENSIPVPYSLVDIEVPRTSPYHARNLGVQAQWADADVDAAAGAMRRLADDGALREALATAGREAARATRDVFETGVILRELAYSRPEGGADARRAAQRAARRLRVTYPADFAVRAARFAARRIRSALAPRA